MISKLVQEVGVMISKLVQEIGLMISRLVQEVGVMISRLVQEVGVMISKLVQEPPPPLPLPPPSPRLNPTIPNFSPPSPRPSTRKPPPSASTAASRGCQPLPPPPPPPPPSSPPKTRSEWEGGGYLPRGGYSLSNASEMTYPSNSKQIAPSPPNQRRQMAPAMSKPVMLPQNQSHRPTLRSEGVPPEMLKRMVTYNTSFRSNNKRQ
ncbi:unnamed protein product, partial [Coregonus sp. 'balchen']